MEVPYVREREEEEEEENGVNLQTRRKSKSHHQNITNISFTSSDTSVVTTDLSICSFEYSSTVSSKEDYYTSNNNGEKPTFNGRRSVNNDEEAVEALSEADEKASFDETNKRENYSNVAHQNQDSNGTTARQKRVGVIESSFSESNGGDKETDIGLNTDAGFRDGGSLLDESSNRVNVASSETYNTENTLRKIVVLNDQGEIIETSHSEDIEPKFEEYHVEKVVEKQKTHDVICPNCKHCITDRVILRRRKRKIDHISPDTPLQEVAEDRDGPHQDENSPGHLDAISCFSCFSIFIPKGDRFLCWRFGPKPSVSLHPGGTPPEHTRPVQLPPEDGTATRFPLWIMTCCQPDHTGKPVSKPGWEPPLTPGPPVAGTGDPGSKDELPSPPSHAVAGQAPPKSQSPIVPDADSKVPGDDIKPPSSTPDDTVVNPTQTPTIPEPAPDFPLWILTCCQPSVGRGKEEHSPEPGSKVPIDKETPPSSPNDTSVQPEEKHLVHSKGVLPSEHKTETTPKIGTGVPHPEEPPTQINETSSSSKQEPLQTPKDHKVDIPSEPRPPSPVTQPKDGPVPGVGATPLRYPPGYRRPGVSGLDIIKAMVYGGLVECITSLSVITSAAGGDATTLNIVALGLANVVGGLVLLLHNLRVLIHEHTADRYEDQLGRRDHFLLHAVVAVISYLVFGLLSPVIYGFSFRKSDNQDYKLATLAAASLVCITVLSMGKAYVRRQAYVQTIFYYLSVGFMVSGVGYVAGDLINMLLKKLGVFDSSALVAMPGLEAGFVDGAWSSY